MTQREAQILRWIQENPLISQQELAERAGIARSSVAVHISNLMKKGCIEGKGYIVRTAPYVVVIGGIRVDIGGRPDRKLDSRTANSGQVRTSLGGTGRNIAHNLRLMGVDVRMLTALGDDICARRICHSCAALGIDLTHSLRVTDAVTSSCVYVTDPQGHPVLAVSDREIYENITPAWLSGHQSLLDAAQLVVFETSIPASSIQWLAHHVKVPLLADPADLSRAELLKPVLAQLHTIKPDLREAEVLTGIGIHDRDSLDRAVSALLEAGLKRVVITLGEHGLYAAEPDRRILLPVPSGVTVSTNGCGDAAAAGLAWAQLEGCELDQAAQAALAAAAITRESSHTVNPDLSPDLLRQRMSAR